VEAKQRGILSIRLTIQDVLNKDGIHFMYIYIYIYIYMQGMTVSFSDCDTT